MNLIMFAVFPQCNYDASRRDQKKRTKREKNKKNENERGKKKNTKQMKETVATERTTGRVSSE